MPTPRQINAERKKNGLPPLNFALFRKVIKKLETAPEAYDQTLWGRKSKAAPCGTAACIAGWAAHLDSKVSLRALQRNRWLSSIASKSLGLNGDEDDNYMCEDDVLFSGDPANDWPKPYRHQWDDARTPQQRSRVAIRYLNHIIKTGKVTE